MGRSFEVFGRQIGGKQDAAAIVAGTAVVAGGFRGIVVRSFTARGEQQGNGKQGG